MRGKQDLFGFRRLFGRNIPAYAGKPGWLGCRHAGVSEHPRVCGENYHAMEYDGGRIGTSPRMRENHAGDWVEDRMGGTSPRMRGKRSCNSRHGADRRNIPAYAGKTALPGGRERAACGTSPRMRGKPRHRHRPPLMIRNIPAYAGKTVMLGFLGVFAWEHPRVCGENSLLYPKEST